VLGKLTSEMLEKALAKNIAKRKREEYKATYNIKSK